ncbi:MAG: hypothetical protein R3D81_11020 [Thalassovita sp.]
MDYNGMKMVRADSAPLDAGTGLAGIKEFAEENAFKKRAMLGIICTPGEARSAYVERICEFVDIAALKPLNILVNAGHGTAGPTFDAIVERLADLGAPLVFERLFHEPDGSFPQGIPNPLLPENRSATAEGQSGNQLILGLRGTVISIAASSLITTGAFIDGEYVVGLMAEAFLAKDPGATIIHDPRIIWNTQDLARKPAVGRFNPHSHAFINKPCAMRTRIHRVHHYFATSSTATSGMIPLLLVAELVSRHGPLADLIADRKCCVSSGTVNFHANIHVAIVVFRQSFNPKPYPSTKWTVWLRHGRLAL